MCSIGKVFFYWPSTLLKLLDDIIDRLYAKIKIFSFIKVVNLYLVMDLIIHNDGSSSQDFD